MAGESRSNSASWCLRKVGGSAQKYGVIPLRNGDEISIGRGTDVTIQLFASKNNASLTLSRKHCIFKQAENGSWTVQDNRSLNGVYVNNSKLQPVVPATLKDGDKVELGRSPNSNEENEFVFTVRQQEQSAEEVDKLLKAWRRRAEKVRQKLAARAAAPQMDSESSVRSESQSGAGNCSNCSVPGDRKRKERDGEGPSRSAVADINEPSTSSDVKRTRISCEGDHLGDSKNFEFRKLMEQVGSDMTADQLVEFTELLKSTKGESVLERLKSTMKKQEEVAEENARLEEEYKTRVEAKEEELRRKDMELLEQRKLQEEALEAQQRLMQEKEEAMARVKQEMQEVLERQVQEKETALVEQLRQQREELLNEKEKVESSLQAEFSKQLEARDRSLKEEQEAMRSQLEEAIRDKEAQMLAQLEAEKQAMIDEKQKVEEKLQTALEKDKGLEEEKQRLDEIIQQKEKEKADIEKEMEASRLKREQEEQIKIALAKQAALDDFTDVMENEFQCSICSELFIQATTLNCSHSFCSYCIGMWLKRKKECPVCRAKMTSNTRSIVLDNYIDKMIEKLGDEAKERRKEILKERKEQNRGDGKIKVAPVVIPAINRNNPVVILDDNENAPVVIPDDIEDAVVVIPAENNTAPVVIPDDNENAPAVIAADNNNAPVVVRDDEDDDDDEEEEDEDPEFPGYWDYDRFGRYRRMDFSDEDNSEEEEPDRYYVGRFGEYRRN